MQALAWDDEPEEYFEDLKVHLASYGIQTEIVSDASSMPALLETKRWDLVITDVFDDKKVAHERSPYGVHIAKLVVEKELPLYVVSSAPTQEKIGDLPSGVPIYSKRTPPGFVAYEICRDLRRRETWVDLQKVFLIYGHDRDSNDASQVIRAELTRWGLQTATISGDSMEGDIVTDLIDSMRDAAAIIAVCTPDDEVVDSTSTVLYRQPRQNVLLEIGMAMGLTRRLKKLSFIQRWHAEDKNLQARLPSDLGGVVTMRFRYDVQEILPSLKQRLVDLGVGLDGR